MWEAELSGHSPSPSLFIVKIAPQHCYIALVLYSAQWFQIAKTRQNYVHLISQFSNLFAADLSTYNISVSGDCMRFVLKKCQNVACTSMIRQFHDFLNYNFWRVFCNLSRMCDSRRKIFNVSLVVAEHRDLEGWCIFFFKSFTLIVCYM